MTVTTFARSQTDAADGSAIWFEGEEYAKPCEGRAGGVMDLAALRKDDGYKRREVHSAELMAEFHKARSSYSRGVV